MFEELFLIVSDIIVDECKNVVISRKKAWE